MCGGVPADVLIEVENGLSGSRLHGGRDAGVKLRMRSVGTADQDELLRHGEIAFGIVRLPVPTPHLVRAVVWDEPLGLVMAREHPLASRVEPTWSELSRQRLLWYDEGCAPGFADTVPAHLARLGWNSVLHPVDRDEHALFLHALQTTADLVALRPRRAVERGTEPGVAAAADEQTTTRAPRRDRGQRQSRCPLSAQGLRGARLDVLRRVTPRPQSACDPGRPPARVTRLFLFRCQAV
ncbi:LysR substrate-binding domain-containing protein [Streptomyces thinghirensis]|nr:LysR substrate-binding domain-containing protein [Streptomyces thinghirensis]